MDAAEIDIATADETTKAYVRKGVIDEAVARLPKPGQHLNTMPKWLSVGASHTAIAAGKWEDWKDAEFTANP
ncbi:MAG: hypothetical protein IPK79_01410 [Vampirovibrionales bacterium]|nr:hypothetical protein [Vampirovibrionales bacterium]